MIITSEQISIASTYNLTPSQWSLLERDTNVLRSLMGKPWQDVITEHTSWMTIHGRQTWQFLGAFMCDKVDEKTGAVCVHIMLREGYSRDFAMIATKLAAFHARLRGLIPYTTVSTDPKYDYMRKFLADCGFVHHTYQEDIEIITIPTHYIPNLPLITIHNGN